MERHELLRSPEYWTATLQIELYNHILRFMKTQGMNKTDLAEYLNCSKSYVTQLLSGSFDHKLSKFFELSLAIGKIPSFTFVDIDDYIETGDQTYSTNIKIAGGYSNSNEPDNNHLKNCA